MTDVTAEVMGRGRVSASDTALERRRSAMQVRAIREKLTSSGSGHRAFDLELLKLYAERRVAALPGLLLLGVAVAAMATQWTRWSFLLAWLGAAALMAFAAAALARRFAATVSNAANVRAWTRLFIGAEALLGCVWAGIAVLAIDASDPSVETFFLVASLLVAAMNATAVATVPGAVFASLAPTTVAVLALLRPQAGAVGSILVTALALGALAFFVVLARKLYVSALQSLDDQAEKDVLIAELEQARQNSDHARARAEESNLAKSRFLATMSHELRTPLNAILGFSEVMKSELFGQHAVAAYRDYSSDIHSSGEHLLMLINEILDLSRVEAGRYELREEPVDLVGLVEECRHLVTLRAKKKDILIVQEPGAEMPKLWADTRAVRQVALNLLSNAIKFTPQGGQVRIAVGWTHGGGQFFSIADTGAGIPESEIPIVMSSFGRGSFAQKTAEEGTGLGLPIVKGLVDLHGGTFTLTSKMREGTTVTVAFPSERVMDVLPLIEVEQPRARVGALKGLRSAA